MFYLVLILIITAFAFTAFAVSLNNDRSNVVKKSKREKSRMLIYTIEKSPARRKDSKKCPLLRPERFRRLIKMRWGIDIKDYPEDASVWFGVGFKLSLNDQSISGYHKFHEDAPFYIVEPFPENIYVTFEKYFIYHDEEAYKILPDYVAIVAKDDEHGDIIYLAVDMLLNTYNTSLSVPVSLIEYVDSMRFTGEHILNISWEYRYEESDDKKEEFRDCNAFRISEIRSNQLYLYIIDQLSKGRVIRNDIDYPRTDMLNMGFYIDSGTMRMPDYITLNPWHTDTRARSLAALLTFLLQLKHPFQRKCVIKYMSGQYDSYSYEEQEKEVREQIRSNNYYGYTVLREFCENPEREMPTLEKVGTSFDAVLAGHPKPLLLEPFADSYDIDTILPDEAFIAYEMGYDDYYFIEIEKPVESPLAGTDGYAMILDRRETVYGYLKKEDVKKISEAEKAALKAAQERVLLQQPGRKIGLIDDPDGYVNLRKGMSVDAEIVSRIERTESFYYWEIPDKNWWFVQKRDGIKGFVHKSRIREKASGESWIIDDKNKQTLGRLRFLL